MKYGAAFFEKAAAIHMKEHRMDQLCSTCAYITYDEEYDEYYCDCRMDEDDYYRISQRYDRSCPYYRNGDEYQVVRKQM